MHFQKICENMITFGNKNENSHTFYNFQMKFLESSTRVLKLIVRNCLCLDITICWETFHSTQAYSKTHQRLWDFFFFNFEKNGSIEPQTILYKVYIVPLPTGIYIKPRILSNLWSLNIYLTFIPTSDFQESTQYIKWGYFCGESKIQTWLKWWNMIGVNR